MAGNPKEIKDKRTQALSQASGKVIGQLAYDAAMWYKAYFLQTVRFFENDQDKLHEPQEPFILPWRENNRMSSRVEREFMIFAIDHALRCLKDLNEALLYRGDHRLNPFKEKLLDANDFYRKVHMLRNAIEHDTEYRLEIGRNQGSFYSKIETAIGKMNTNPLRYIQVEDQCFIGDMDCLGMLKHMAEVRDEIIPLLEKIFCKYYFEEYNDGKNET